MIFYVLKPGHYETFMRHKCVWELVKTPDEGEPTILRMAAFINPLLPEPLPFIWWDRELIRGLIEFEGLLIRSID